MFFTKLDKSLKILERQLISQLSPMKIHPSLHHPSCRELLESKIQANSLIWPVFVTHREEDRPIKGFSPNIQWGRGDSNEAFNSLLNKCEELLSRGLRHIMLFGVVEEKDHVGSKADCSEECPVISCIKAIRSRDSLSRLAIYADVCLCEYTDHGHCGLLREVGGEQVIDNAKSVERLSVVAAAYGHAGADCVCPSDMMDGRIGAIRKNLDAEGLGHVMIMSYTSKKASVMYSPFRAAVESTFKGDRKRYQQPVGSSSVAMRSLARDQREGADIVLVKPSLMYGDIIKAYKDSAHVPVAAYVVSGEYKMLYDYGTATETFEETVREAHVSLVRAGASVLITYFTPYILENLNNW